MAPPPAISQQAIRYGIVGIVQVGIDWAIFVLITQFSSFLGVANVGSRVCGAVAGFWLNGRWTFPSATRRLGPHHVLRYIVSWLIMTALSTVAVIAVDDSHGLGWTRAVKPFVDALLAIGGFLISKYWIYTARSANTAGRQRREAP